MADFNRKKLQVFVSSTYNDLIPERQAAVEAILTAGHIPAGMELFTAGDESQMDVIKQWIDESDVYLLILGGRYGSIEPTTANSYTQLEYEYAVSKSKPLFACVINDAAIEARVKAAGRSVLETEYPQKLKEFRAAVLSKMSKFWDDTKDIKIAVTETLSRFERREDLEGWVRPNTQSDLPALADEIARLSKENAQLRAQIASVTQSGLINGLSFEDLMALLEDRGVLAFIEDNRYALRHPSGFRGYNDKVQGLYELGLVARPDGFGVTRISEAGGIFLNKLEIFRLKSKTLSPPK